MTTKSPRETSKLLQHHYCSSGGLRIVVARILEDEDKKEDSSANIIERYHKLNSSLSVRLESQNAEVEHWRQECNRLER